MRVYILRRLLQIIPTILGITFVVFVMMRSIPGDPVVSLLGDAYTEENAIKARQDYGLDKPVLVQYVIWLGKLVQGDWGTSLRTGRPLRIDVPQSPCTSLPSQITYWNRTGLSSPYDCRTLIASSSLYASPSSAT